jgi:hypothetical protein
VIADGERWVVTGLTDRPSFSVAARREGTGAGDSGVSEWTWSVTRPRLKATNQEEGLKFAVCSSISAACEVRNVGVHGCAIRMCCDGSHFGFHINQRKGNYCNNLDAARTDYKGAL